jgi:hypothetical protein
MLAGLRLLGEQIRLSPAQYIGDRVDINTLADQSVQKTLKSTATFNGNETGVHSSIPPPQLLSHPNLPVFPSLSFPSSYFNLFSIFNCTL